MKNLRWLIVLILSVWLAGCSLDSVVEESNITMIYSGNLDGELEPCGCSDEGNFGGIMRRVTTLDKLRQEQPNLIAISSGGLLSSEGAGDDIKSDYILKGFRSFNYDAVAVQWRDLSFGVKTMNADLPWVASNWADKTVSKFKVITRKIGRVENKFHFFAWLDPESSPMRQMQGAHSLVKEQVLPLADQLMKAKQSNGITILSTTLPFERLQQLISLKHVDVLLVKSAYEVFGEPKLHENTLVLQPGSRGMRIARLDLVIGGGKVKSWQHKVIPMPETVPDAPQMAQWYEEYNDKVKQDYLQRVEIRKQRTSGKSDFSGEEKCIACHKSQHDIWSASQHAIAFEDLEEVNKSFDPACIICHTVGFDKPGGFVDMSITSHLLGVQCESCHGVARQHVESAGAKPVGNADWKPSQMCAQCHTQPHSPSFSFEKYWPKIAH